ncbi:sulfide/dihydroorotate dehydrogenase-like FAD/NAD-binding protein [Candidatus Bathyarchaeota archaeon]|nr:sulfide/dihydroorotate dehydrogenase-like FAD/NAD-binding protein [Candidatus Bathyarchaeota archaeon]
MYEIVHKETLSHNVKLIEVSAPAVVKKTKPGQFVIIRIHEKGERFPITIADSNPVKGTLTLIYAEVGKSSSLLGKMKVGESILNLAGPLGNPTKIKNYGKILCVGGGVMVGALLLQLRALKNAGNEIITIVGARNKDHLILVDEIKKVSNKTYLATDDGSEGYLGIDFLSDILKENKFDHVFTIGPTSMQKIVSEMTNNYHIPTTVNLFPIMVDGTGMCGACRVTIGNTTRFACVHGPDFDGHQVDFDELISRMRFYNPNEKIAMVLYDGR